MTNSETKEMARGIFANHEKLDQIHITEDGHRWSEKMKATKYANKQNPSSRIDSYYRNSIDIEDAPEDKGTEEAKLEFDDFSKAKIEIFLKSFEVEYDDKANKQPMIDLLLEKVSIDAIKAFLGSQEVNYEEEASYKDLLSLLIK